MTSEPINSALPIGHNESVSDAGQISDFRTLLSALSPLFIDHVRAEIIQILHLRDSEGSLPKCGKGTIRSEMLAKEIAEQLVI